MRRVAWQEKRLPSCCPRCLMFCSFTQWKLSMIISLNCLYIPQHQILRGSTPWKLAPSHSAPAFSSIEESEFTYTLAFKHSSTASEPQKVRRGIRGQEWLTRLCWLSWLAMLVQLATAEIFWVSVFFWVRLEWGESECLSALVRVQLVLFICLTIIGDPLELWVTFPCVGWALADDTQLKRLLSHLFSSN